MKSKTLKFVKLLVYSFTALIMILSAVLVSLMLSQDKMENDKTIVVFETTKGNIEIELFLDESPMTAGNFKKLVEEGFYDKTKFHRVIPNFMVQGGDPLSKNDSMTNRWGTGGPGYAIQDEFIEGLSNVRGSLSMANSGPNSGGSQFFINTVNNTNLDWDKAPSQSKHPVFGKVILGLEIVDAISKVRTTGSDRPLEDIEIIKAYILKQ